jgi:hypothetical protein
LIVAVEAATHEDKVFGSLVVVETLLHAGI